MTEELTPNHLLTMDDLIGLKIVDNGLPYEAGRITSDEIAVIVKRERFEPAIISETAIVSADFQPRRMRIIFDGNDIITRYESG